MLRVLCDDDGILSGTKCFFDTVKDFARENLEVISVLKTYFKKEINERKENHWERK